VTRAGRIEQFDAANLDLARKVRERPWLFEAHLVAWSRHVLKRLGTPEEQHALEFEDSLEEKR
jgi:hypothetical protein